MDMENRDTLVKAYLSYADSVEREEEKSLVRFKKNSYNSKFQ